MHFLDFLRFFSFSDIRQQLEEIIQGGLEGNEYVSLLSWVMNIYPGPELMSHPDLQVDLANLEPLINERSLKELENEYLKVRFPQIGRSAHKQRLIFFCKFHIFR